MNNHIELYQRVRRVEKSAFLQGEVLRNSGEYAPPDIVNNLLQVIVNRSSTHAQASIGAMSAMFTCGASVEMYNVFRRNERLTKSVRVCATELMFKTNHSVAITTIGDDIEWHGTRTAMANIGYIPPLYKVWLKSEEGRNRVFPALLSTRDVVGWEGCDTLAMVANHPVTSTEHRTQAILALKKHGWFSDEKLQVDTDAPSRLQIAYAFFQDDEHLLAGYALNGKTSEIQCIAIEYLSKVSPGSIVLSKLAYNSATPAKVRYKAIEACISSVSLGEIAQSARKKFAIAAIKQIGRIKATECVELLKDLSVIRPEVKTSCIRALGEIGDPSAIETILPVLSGSSLGNARSALKALVKLGANHLARPYIYDLFSRTKAVPHAAQLVATLGKVQGSSFSVALALERKGNWNTLVGLLSQTKLNSDGVDALWDASQRF